MAGQFQPLLVGAHGKRLNRALEAVTQAEGSAIEVELAYLDLGEVEDVVQQPQQRIGRAFDHGQGLALFGGEFRIEHQFCHADDPVHGSADLVTHVGQELTLGPGGGFSRAFGLLPLLCHPLVLGDVASDCVNQLL